ncbi:MAG: hypothetical protein RMJ67_09430 [Elusimicrobiota bacterium]|nr:hypothetical protein [Endomicrobiia bacterium]MDW8166718.1 hypothetical protein [Elusimicrobiota bacterium]
MKVFISLLLCFLLVTNSFAMDVGCVVGGCENKAETEQEEMYECVCPPKDTVGTILDVVGVLTLPLQFFSNKPRFDVGARGIEGLIEKGCKCKPKFRNYQEYRQYYYGDQQDNQ